MQRNDQRFRRSTWKFWLGCFAALGLAVTSTGCIAKAFNEPITLSSRASAVSGGERLGPVSAEQCGMVILILPIPADPRDGYDDLLAEATRMGGNAVIDMQVRGSKSIAFIPLFQRTCIEYAGIAMKL